MSKRVLVTQGMKRRRLREVLLRVFWWNRVCVSAGCSAEADVNAGQLSCSLQLVLRARAIDWMTSVERRRSS
ncbi:hypothetical protein F511_39537 [Dorcoceras hygrometricum]|uniref:Uncharacterized protein n=1 Tax=Dorcoceras hygrometricum TaxID=472368 RepID=A0A2Z7CPL9_9LAMI|nr:hypothetical protein F511_39537 [Dorcoceras hygrometricum]